jgi:SAM-dependent methyltransferase
MVVLERVIESVRVGRKTVTILDAGCGTGAACVDRFAEMAGVEVLGVDRSPEAVAEARQRAQGLSHLDFSVSDLGNVTGSFDVVFCALVLHMVPDQEAFLAHLWRLVAPGGCLVVRGLDDGLSLCWPDSSAAEKIARLTPLVFSSLDRIHGRKLPVQMGHLSDISRLEVEYSSITTQQGREDYFELTQGWKSSVVMEGADEEVVAEYQELREAIESERSRYYGSADLFASSTMIIVSAYRS